MPNTVPPSNDLKQDLKKDQVASPTAIPLATPHEHHEGADNKNPITAIQGHGHDSVHSSLTSLTTLPQLERINEALGLVISNFTYEEYRQFTGLLAHLRTEERHATEAEGRKFAQSQMPTLVFPGEQKEERKEIGIGAERPKETGIDRLMEFVAGSQNENMRQIKGLLEQKKGFDERNVMKELMLLARLYYVKGVNMLNPDDPNTALKLNDDEDIVLRIPGECTVLSVGKRNGKVIAEYPDASGEWVRISLDDGKTYIFGREARRFAVKNCPKGLKEIMAGRPVTPVNGVITDSISRAGIGVEVRGDEVLFYDRASKNHVSFSRQKLAPQQGFSGKDRICHYKSQPVRGMDGAIRLGYIERTM